MADWRKVALAAILADGKVDDTEVKVLQRELKEADGKIGEDGIKFLIELRAQAQKKAKAKKEELSDSFEKFFAKVVTDNVLKEGKIDATSASWLKNNLFSEKKVDEKHYELLGSLGKKAKDKSPEFEQLVKDTEATRAKAKK